MREIYVPWTRSDADANATSRREGDLVLVERRHDESDGPRLRHQGDVVRARVQRAAAQELSPSRDSRIAVPEQIHPVRPSIRKAVEQAAQRAAAERFPNLSPRWHEYMHVATSTRTPPRGSSTRLDAAQQDHDPWEAVDASIDAARGFASEGESELLEPHDSDEPNPMERAYLEFAASVDATTRLEPGTDDLTALRNLGWLVAGARGRWLPSRKPYVWSRRADPRDQWESDTDAAAFAIVCAAHDRLALLPRDDAHVLDRYVRGLATQPGVLTEAWQCWEQTAPDALAMSVAEADRLVAYLGPTIERAALVAGIGRTTLANYRRRGQLSDSSARLLRLAAVTRLCSFLDPTQREGAVAALTAAQRFLDAPRSCFLGTHAMQLVDRAWSIGPDATAFDALFSFAAEELRAA